MTTRQLHLLYVAWGYPPSRGGGVYRALATANAFARAGWRVTVITPEDDTFLAVGTDPSLEAEIDPSITVERTQSNVAAYQHNIGVWPWYRARFSEIWNGLRILRDRRIFPEETYGSWRTRLGRAAVRIHKSDPVDLVVGTANPHADFIPGYVLGRRFGVPYVMDYRDAWQLSTYSGERITSPTSSIARWEDRLIKGAHEVWFVNEPIREWHARLYPEAAERMHVVMNGYDENLAGFPSAVRPDRAGGLVFGYIGTISPNMPMRDLFEGWRLARERSPLIAASRMHVHGYLGHARYLRDELLNLFAEYSGDGIEYLGPVAKANIAKTYESFDALLFVLGKGRYVTSGKVFEYAATGLPIVSVHHPVNAATQVLDGHPAWSWIQSQTPTDIADSLIAGGEMSVNQTPELRAAAQRWAAKYERMNQLKPRIAALTEFIGFEEERQK